MPKDNEVDEKVMPEPLTYGMRRKGETAVIGLIPPKVHAIPPKVAEYLRDYEEVPLYSAATVAELRAEVAKARISGIDACDKLTTLWQKDIDRADAAERRVGELERACKPIIEKSIAISKKTSSVFTSDLRRLLAALTGADPT